MPSKAGPTRQLSPSPSSFLFGAPPTRATSHASIPPLPLPRMAAEAQAAASARTAAHSRGSDRGGGGGGRARLAQTALSLSSGASAVTHDSLFHAGRKEGSDGRRNVHPRGAGLLGRLVAATSFSLRLSTSSCLGHGGSASYSVTASQSSSRRGSDPQRQRGGVGMRDGAAAALRGAGCGLRQRSRGAEGLCSGPAVEAKKEGES